MMKKETTECFECDSLYYAESSKMGALCPDCSHHLYGFKNCEHEFKDGRCVKCYWNDKSSEYIDKLKSK